MPKISAPSETAKLSLGNPRKTGKEQFFTPRSLADRLVLRLQSLIPDLTQRTVLEPAGGTGAFLDALSDLGVSSLISFDIEPRHSSVQRGDFLKSKLKHRGLITVSNPPFGRNNSLSIPFFNHAASSSDYIAFIVPRSWRKWSVTNRLHRSFHLIHDEDLQIEYVDEFGEASWAKNRLKTCFQVWERRENLRPLISVRDHGWVSRSTPAEADVALTIFGHSCGRVKVDFERVPNSTQMFLRLNHPEALAALQRVDYSRFFRNTAYTEALSLVEINFLLNEAILGNPDLIESS